MNVAVRSTCDARDTLSRGRLSSHVEYLDFCLHISKLHLLHSQSDYNFYIILIMKVSILTPLCLLLSTVPSTYAWGTLGHQTVAYVASNFVNPDTKTYFQTLLGDKTDDYLARVATWADSFRYTAAGRFSASFHYIDANDTPPTSCGIEYARDCGEKGCVVAAIQNYVSHASQNNGIDGFKRLIIQTMRVMDNTLLATERVMAAKVRSSPFPAKILS
jgi:hypothetical protein